MLGKLTWDAVPFDQPIPMAASGVVALAILAVLAWVVIRGHLPYKTVEDLRQATRPVHVGNSGSPLVTLLKRGLNLNVNTVEGYGKAEALLYFKHPYRFNMLGQSRWLGRIYGDFTTSLFSRRPVIYSGTFGRDITFAIVSLKLLVGGLFLAVVGWRRFRAAR